MELKFRELRADEIDCRVATITEKGLSLLLYKDARVDMSILDEVVGPMNWQKSYQLIDGQLFCTLQIWDTEKNMWISKQDVGVESNTEAEKGRASDAQKRAAFAFGIGRSLYTAPFIWISSDRCRIKEGRNGKLQCNDRFAVDKYEVTDGKISGLTIVNETSNEVVFAIGGTRKEEPSKQKKTEKHENQFQYGVTADCVTQIMMLAAQVGVSESDMLSKVGCKDWHEVPAKAFKQLSGALKVKKQAMDARSGG